MKKQIFLCLFVLLIIMPGLVLAGVTGKITGKVIDRETNEPLPGANVVIEGTFLGAAADVNGDFVILNVPPGTYSVKGTFIGYRSLTVANVIVSVDLTTTTNLALPSEAIAVDAVTIVAERPLIQKNATNETHIMTAQDMENIPIRSYASVVATNSGVVTARDDMYVRGGRRDEVAYYVDGVYSNDLRTGRRTGDIPINSIEQISYQAGGFTAEYGFANSGVIMTTSQAGRDAYKISGEVITDEFLSKEDKVLGTYSYGYNVYNLAVSGPILSRHIRFFGAAEQTFMRDRRPTSGAYPVLAGNFSQGDINLTADSLTSLGVPATDWILPIELRNGPLPNNAQNRWSFNGNLLLDYTSIKVKLGGNGTLDKYHRYDQRNALANLAHNAYTEDFSTSVYAKITHTLGSKTYYEATGYYSLYGGEDMDPVFKRNVFDYGDKDDLDDDGLFAPYIYDNGINTAAKRRLGTGVFRPLQTYDEYELNRASVYGAKLDFTHQIGLIHEIKTGFEYRYNTLRRYYVGQPEEIAGNWDETINAFVAGPRLAYRACYTDNFGYPISFPGDVVDPGEVVNSGPDKAKHPLLAAFYLQDKIELSDLILNLGVRMDYIDANDKKIRDPYNVLIRGGFLDDANFVDTESHMAISPRIGMSFPVTDKTVFHAQWGKFTQQPELQYLYTGWDYYGGQLAQGNQVTIGNPDLKPVTTTAYEVGFGQQLGLNASLNITAYYKEIRDLIVLKNRVNARPVTYPQYQNGDYGTTKGISMNFRLRRIQRVAANLNYTLQWARGTGSTAGTSFYITWIGTEYYPTFVSPLDYDQRHTLSANVDFRTNPNDGPTLFGIHPFGDMGLNLLAQIGSGFPFTPKKIGETVFTARFSTAFPTAATNSAYTEWTYDIGMRLDKNIKLGTMDFNVYLWVTNLFDTKTPFNRRDDRGQVYFDRGQSDLGSGIYEATGQPDDNGFLDTVEGQRWLQDNGGARAEAMYRARINNPANWQAPRQVRLGLRFNINP